MVESGRKYGTVTAISMVAGGVIGSGVFFKTESITRITDGNIVCCVAAWLTGAVVMLLCLLAFAKITEKYEGGLYHIAQKLVGGRFPRFVGIFMAGVYYPSLVSVLSYLTAKYTLLVFGWESAFLCAVTAIFFLATSFLQNAFLPRFSKKVQLATTVIKLVPLFVMIVLGITKGVLSGILHKNMIAESSVSFEKAFFPSVTATLFAYEGWISALGVGKNLKNSRRNLPLALIVGGALISAVYVLYYLGVMGAIESVALINYGTTGIKNAFYNIVGKWGDLLGAFVAISCFGALGTLVMGCEHATGEFFNADKGKSAFIGGVMSFLWLVYLVCTQSENGLIQKLHFDSTQLPVVTVYVLYIFIFFAFLRTERGTKTVILCTGGICASLFSIICGIISHSEEIISYILVLFAIILFYSVLGKKSP